MMISPLRFARNSFLFFLFGLLALVLPAMPLEAGNPASLDAETVTADPNVRAVANANTDFGFRLLTQLNQATPHQNIFFSPFSLSNCLTMVVNGAGGETQTAMTSTLGLQTMTLDQINQANGLLLPSLENSDPNVAISVANALWANTGTIFDPKFQQRSDTFYDTHTETLDFNSPTASNTINGWVKDNTQGKIDTLVSSGDLHNAKAVLTNAVYFHGPWSRPFEKWDTHNGPFALTPSKNKTMPMMLQYGTYPYLDTPQFQAVSLPYGSGRMSMEIFLPKTGTDLTAFVMGLNGATWNNWLNQMKPTVMNIILPRFKADYEATLNRPLIGLGMNDAFRHGADFSPMGLPGSAISKVIHKAIIDVDEKGTVAAAATAVVLQLSGHQPPKTEMHVDHPFFVAIRDSTTGTLLFVGVIRDPQ